MPEHIAIITVVYNNYTILDEFCDSLRRQKMKSFHLYLADASSQKKSINIPDIPHTVFPIENKGYAHGVNEGLKRAMQDGFEKFCIINDDVVFSKTFVEELENGFRSHPNSLFGGKIYYAPGFEYHQQRYSAQDRGKVLWYAGGAVDWDHATPSHIGVDEVDKGQYDAPVQTDFISGCCMCFDKNVVDQLGYWDEQYFLYYEDSDYCERAKQNNIPLWYIPSITVWHKNAQSTDGSGSALHRRYQKKAHFRFAMKYAPLRTKLHVLKNYFFQPK